MLTGTSQQTSLAIELQSAINEFNLKGQLLLQCMESALGHHSKEIPIKTVSITQITQTWRSRPASPLPASQLEEKGSHLDNSISVTAKR